VLQRGHRLARISLAPAGDAALNATFVPAGAVLRALGVLVGYDSAARRLVVFVPGGAILASPTPFDPSAPSVAPSNVFTPAPSVVPHPRWTGTPLPRRTALPFPPGR
jgi:hypothetical protein